MKLPRSPHSWSVSPKQAIEIQKELAPKVIRRGTIQPLRLVAGCDLAFSKDKTRCIAGVVVWDVREREVVEERTAWRDVRFPYVPGLLSFREAPAILACLRKLRTAPDLLMLDGQGYAHPRRFGLACHVGVITNLPTIGVAKSVLVGDFDEPGRQRGESSPMKHKGEVVGKAVRTRDDVKPVYVSVGHKVSLPFAVKAALACGKGYRVPEPTRLADRLVARVKAN